MSTIIRSNSRKKNQRLLANLLIIYTYIFVAFFMSYFFTDFDLKTTLFYCGVILSSVMFASFAEISQKNKLFYSIFMFSSFFIVFFVFGFRDLSAIDDISYKRIFEQVSYIGWFEQFKLTTMEPGYLVLNHFVGLFTNDYLYMQLITSFIPLFLFYYGFNKYKGIISIPTAVFLLCSMLYFQMLAVALIRMFIALGIVFVSLRFIPEKKPKRFALYILLASTFHYSALFLISLTYFSLSKNALKDKTIKLYFLLLTFSPIVFIFIGKFLVPILGSRYSSYGSIDSVNLSVGSFTTLPLIFLLIFFSRKFTDKEKLYFKLFTFVYSTSIIVGVFGDMISLGRLIFYSYIAFILAASMISKNIRFNSSKLIYSSIIIVYGFIYVFYSQFTFEPHVPNLYPYSNIFFKL